MLKTDLLDNLIHKYELNEDSSIDDVFSDAQKTDPRYRTLSKEDCINLQRAFSNFWYASDEVPSIENQQNKSDLEASESQQLSRPVNCCTTNMPSHNRRPHKKYVEAFVNNISVPKSLDELNNYFLEGNDAQNLIRDILGSGRTCWTVPRWAKRGDIVLFMHAKTAKSTLTRLRTEVRSEYSSDSQEAIQLEKAIADQIAFHKKYGGRIYAIGRVSGNPEIDDDIIPGLHSKSRIFADIDSLFLLDQPVDISEFNGFIKISRVKLMVSGR